ncbi:MAG: tetratricopeptide repeat protein [Bacteroidales bacterium]|nr:tetratricopeptide repeat protein [Bacteroidales bacterium]
MKNLFYVWLFLPLIANAQSNLPSQTADSLWQVWQDETQSDSIRLKALDTFIWRKYLFTQPDSAFYYAQLEFEYAKSRGLKIHMADALNTQGISFAIRGNSERAIDYFIRSLKIKEEIEDQMGVANLLNNIGIIYEDLGDYTRAIDNYMQSLDIQEEIGNMKGMANALNNIGNSFYNQNDFIKAIDYHTRSLNLKEKIGDNKGISESLNNLGLVYQKQGDLTKALDAFTRSLEIKEEFGDKQGMANSLNNIGFLYLEQSNYNSALLFSRRALNMAKEVGAVSQTRDAAKSLWEIQKNSGNYKQGLEMYELYIQMRDSILSEENVKEVIRQEYQYAYEKQAVADSVSNARAAELKNAQIAQQQAELKAKRNQQYGLFIGLALMVIIAGNAYYRFQSKKKANVVLHKTLSDLKSTQAQLIQSEKMASLGELTAGIAHEIQNPLNFVNNFAEVSSEMIDEANQELAVGNGQFAKEILTDIRQNLEKINHHGKRADAIVKGMLQHSRTSNGVKEPTDINALADEYLRLSYHGLRARDKSFNADFKTDFDETLPKISVIQQNIGRVLLNLINNAFYAVSEKNLSGLEENYKPAVTISTKNLGDQIEISVKDNGNGIPEEIKNKIFQPFFTTKPTGQGTGLGLSLSYDIVKAHGGVLNFSTSPGGTIFKILLNK